VVIFRFDSELNFANKDVFHAVSLRSGAGTSVYLLGTGVALPD